MMRERAPVVYILASGFHGTLYIGVTSDLPGRLWQHRQGVGRGFTSRYGVTRLVLAEPFDRMEDAIAREKQLKHWRRAWKVNLIEAANPTWRDLAAELGLSESAEAEDGC